MNASVVANDLKLPFRKSPGIFNAVWIPLLILLGLVLIDTFLIPEAFTLPLLLYLTLGFLAVRLPPWVVFVWALIYAGFILIILLLPIQEGRTDPVLAPYVRTAIFLTGGVVITFLSGYRARVETSYNALLSVVSALPLAVIISDVSGNILLLNKAAEKLLSGQLNDLAGLSFFSTFTSADDQGRAIAKYISYFNPQNVGPFEVNLQTRGTNPLVLKASISVVESANQSYAVTIVRPPDPVPTT